MFLDVEPKSKWSLIDKRDKRHYIIIRFLKCINHPFLIIIIRNILDTRLFGRFAPIFYFNCEHVLFVNNLHCQKKVRGFHKKINGFLQK